MRSHYGDDALHGEAAYGALFRGGSHAVCREQRSCVPGAEHLLRDEHRPCRQQLRLHGLLPREFPVEAVRRKRVSIQRKLNGHLICSLRSVTPSYLLH